MGGFVIYVRDVVKVLEKDMTGICRQQRKSEGAAVKRVSPVRQQRASSARALPRERYERSGISESCQSRDGRGRSRLDAPMQD